MPDSVATVESVPRVPLLCAGAWRQSLATDEDCVDVCNPSTGEVIARTPLCTAGEIDETLSAAVRAAADWADVPVVERARVMFRYRDLLEQEAESLARLITREHGKTVPESRAEVRRGIEVVEFACGIPSLLAGESLANIARDVDIDLARRPVGVCLGITPYNFPAMVPMWMFPIAITCGNVFVLKPSERTPLSAVRLGELLVDAGCPPGVFSIVHGARPTVESLLADARVAAVSFVGSSAAAQSVYRLGAMHGKRVQAAGGAKNHLVIMPDADPQLTVEALSAAAYGCGGQRCMAVSVAVAVGREADAIVDQLRDHAAGLRIGRTDTDDAVDLGPLIRPEQVERVSDYLRHAEQDGATIALDGRQTSGNGFFVGPSLVDHVEPGMRVARDEVFGPLLSVMRARDLDHALELAGQSQYGNGAAIFTRDGHAAREFRRRSPAGMVGVNVAVPAPMAWYPFTGWNGSFFGDLHMQGREGIQFYTRQQVTLSRWFAPSSDTKHDDPLWSATRR